MKVALGPLTACLGAWACAPVPAPDPVPEAAAIREVSTPPDETVREPPVRLALGRRHLCLVGNDALHCWSRLGPRLEKHTATGKFVETAVSSAVACALDGEGRVQCGVPTSDDASLTLRPVAGLPIIEQLVGTQGFVCARSERGQVYCFQTPGARTEVPTLVVADGSQKLASSESQACSVASSGRATCFGQLNEKAELPHTFSRLLLLGDSVCDAPLGQPPRCWPLRQRSHHLSEPFAGLAEPLPPGSRVVSADRYACTLSAGQARCFGDDAWGAAQNPEGLGPLTEIAAADHATCALDTASRLHCWGRIRPSFPSRVDAPTRVRLPSPANQLVAGDHQSCARLEGNRWVCWGQAWSWGSAWEVGGWPPPTEPPPHRFAPTLLSELDDASTLLMGGGFACWIARGSLSCLTPDEAPEEKPDAFERLRTVRVGPARRAWAGGDLICLAAGSGHTSCVRPSQPDVTVFDFAKERPSDVHIGPEVLCALTRKELRCRNVDPATPLDVVVGGTGSLFTAPSLGTLWRAQPGGHVAVEWPLEEAVEYTTLRYPGRILTTAGFFGSNCALLDDATVWCGGGDRTTPRQVLADVVDLVSGQRSFCARQRDGLVSCWGNNGSGQLGVGETPYTSTPERVSP
jgi:hypothetical protein